MSNHTSFARSNYFAVRDEEAFRAYCERYGFTVIEDTLEGDERVFGFTSDDGEGIPIIHTDKQSGEQRDCDPIAELAGHVAPGDVAVVYEIGHTQTAVLTGYAYAVNSEGATASVGLEDIYEAARKLGTREPTACRN